VRLARRALTRAAGGREKIQPESHAIDGGIAKRWRILRKIF
jgi:hypothetical protein